MIMTLDVYKFRDLFNRVRPQQFTYEALGELFEYYEELGEDVEQGSEEHRDAVEADAYILELDNGNALVQEY